MPLDWRSHTGLLLPFAYVEFVFDSEVYNETNFLNQQSSNSQQINQLEKPAGKMITVKASWETILWGGDSACESSFNIQRDQLLKQSALSLNDCCIQYVTIWPRVDRKMQVFRLKSQGNMWNYFTCQRTTTCHLLSICHGVFTQGGDTEKPLLFEVCPILPNISKKWQRIM